MTGDERLTDDERNGITYAAGHLIDGIRSQESAMPDRHAGDSIDLAWDVFESIVAAHVAAERERIAEAIEVLIDADPHYEPRREVLEDAARIAREEGKC